MAKSKLGSLYSEAVESLNKFSLRKKMKKLLYLSIQIKILMN